ncbi:fumarylacetoacetate hydrolase family protein [Azohydromonas caseinilytica]|uniref:Fumarylacetoacetate hydrolase family protein n=1 Tax=Azohydromonas caseinilytica TaxID=2728836 RepID=A0A848FGA9_9BURK|nr:fumarylacetoacetate hydrolase family protein [Azohydromonas caseinilytica]NML17885.1 fumarylacetoacetate hydrolase family protein [Azohydromonas caseinilytica]
MHSLWIRYEHDGRAGFGRLDGERVHEHQGDLFARHEPTGRSFALSELRLLAPTQPSKVVAMWNNFGALRARLGLGLPEEPLYLLKSPNSWCASGDAVAVPRCGGKVVFEGELGIVIGRRCSGVSEAQALEHVFGYTCANDVTQAEILNRDASFAQWTRAKGFDTFCPMGPAIATGLDPQTLRVRTLLDGQVRQDYPISDMTFPVPRLVSLISQDMTLLPGDVILCGTSVGVGSMKPGSLVEVEIEGIGRLSNRFG